MPAILDVEGRRCLVVGAGKAASWKIAALVAADADVVVVAPRALVELPDAVTFEPRPWAPADVDGCAIVVTAADDAAVNEQAARAAKAAGALVLRADSPGIGDLRLPAVHRSGTVTFSVDTGRASPTLSSALRDRVAELEGGRWAALADWARANRPVSRAEARRRVREATREPEPGGAR
ncbi:MAG: NAD(P)-dependent oxidoreductase [Actinomycetota bacterium]|nr:NAD(P)-dependent oxidoreductase [Actinomycetota bacterium]